MIEGDRRMNERPSSHLDDVHYRLLRLEEKGKESDDWRKEYGEKIDCIAENIASQKSFIAGIVITITAIAGCVTWFFTNLSHKFSL